MSAAKRNPFALSAISKPILALGVILFLSIIGMGGSLWYADIQQGNQQQYLEIVSEQKLLSQRLATLSLESAAGRETAFAQLLSFRDRYDETLHIFENGNLRSGLPALPAPTRGQFAAVKSVWLGEDGESGLDSYRGNINSILEGKLAISEVGEFVLVIQEFIPQLLSFSEQVVDLLVERNAPPRQVFMASRQLMLTQRIENNMNRVLAGGEGAAAAADRFGRDAARFGSVLEGMLKGSSALRIEQIDDEVVRVKLREVAMLFSSVSDHVEAILELSPDLFDVKSAAGEVEAFGAQLLQETELLERQIIKHGEFLEVTRWVGFGFGGLAVLVIIIAGVLLIRDSGEREDARLSRTGEISARSLDCWMKWPTLRKVI